MKIVKVTKKPRQNSTKITKSKKSNILKIIKFASFLSRVPENHVCLEKVTCEPASSFVKNN
jgi:hypothetical protein